MPQEKPYNIQFEYHDKYIVALVSGEKDSLEVSLMFWKEIFDECEANKIKRVLIIENFRNDISAIDMYILGEKLIEMAPKNMMAAFVDNQLQQLEMNKFTETVAYNRGGKGKAFASRKEAEKWLIEQED
ncbi:MAG TPA: hypothetical protein VHI78_05150 [Bacteroidales bacterium]|nr:hypothetical protein [Bacteroidales bacterium]